MKKIKTLRKLVNYFLLKEELDYDIKNKKAIDDLELLAKYSSNSTLKDYYNLIKYYILNKEYKELNDDIKKFVDAINSNDNIMKNIILFRIIKFINKSPEKRYYDILDKFSIGRLDSNPTRLKDIAKKAEDMLGFASIYDYNKTIKK